MAPRADHPILRRVRSFLQEPRLAGVDVDGSERIRVHRRILESKVVIRDVFIEFYRLARSLEGRYFTGAGHRLEVGAGVSLFREVFPDVTSSDIVLGGHLDLIVDALALPFQASSLRAVYGINCFHHLPDPDRFFTELERALVPGGGCVLIDPYHGPLARRFYNRVFEQEHFDVEQPDWTPPSRRMTAMRGANQALSYIVFVRDIDRLRLSHPQLEVVFSEPLTNYPRYFLSGGLNFRSLVPAPLVPILRLAEWLIYPVRRLLALHHVIVIRRLSSKPDLTEISTKI